MQIQTKAKNYYKCMNATISNSISLLKSNIILNQFHRIVMISQKRMVYYLHN